MTLFVDAEHLLDLRLGLQHEVLGAAAAEYHHAASAATTLRFQYDRRRLVDIEIGIEHQLVAVESDGSDVHSNRAVTGR